MNRHLLLCGAMLALCVAYPVRSSAQEAAQTPALGDVHRATLRFHGLDGNLDRWSRRARLTGLMPTIELQAGWRGEQDRETSYREDQRFDALGASSASTIASRDQVRNELDHGSSTQQTYGLKLRLDPGALVFDPRELQAARHAHQLALHRSRLLDRVSELYFDRERARARHASCRPVQSEECELLFIEILQSDARLDALTGGWWSEQLEAIPPRQEQTAEVIP